MVEFGTSSAFRGWIRVRVLGYGFGVRGRKVKSRDCALASDLVRAMKYRVQYHTVPIKFYSAEFPASKQPLFKIKKENNLRHAKPRLDISTSPMEIPSNSIVLTGIVVVRFGGLSIQNPT